MLAFTFGVGFLGSIMFALPQVIDADLEKNGTLGLTLLDLFDNKAFGYGLLIVGLLECVLVAWIYGIKRFVKERNQGGAPSLVDKVFMALIGIIIPVTLVYLLGSAAWDEYQGGLYGRNLVDPAVIGGDGGWQWLATAVPIVWIVGTVGVALRLTVMHERAAPAGVDRAEEARA